MDTEATDESGSDRFATIDEACEAIRRLQPADYVKLMVIARYFARHRLVGTVIQAEDLLHDAVVKTVDGTRRWKRSVSIVRHLDRAMENGSGHAVRKAKRTQPLESIGDAEPMSDEASVYDRLIAKEQLEQVLPLLESDERALDVLRLTADGYAASDIRQKLSMSERDYDTVSRRIRRLRTRLLRGGD